MNYRPKYQIYLASKSPRRKQFLQDYGLKFKCISSEIDEIFEKNLSVSLNLLKITEEKISASLEQIKSKKYIVIGADTCVVMGTKILGKPKDKKEARGMLHRLSGRTHIVYTGLVMLRSDGEKYSKVVKSHVTFKKLTDKEIEIYINCGEGNDKAGSYAIQGCGAYIVRKINGSYSNVVGLPMCEFHEGLGILINR